MPTATAIDPADHINLVYYVYARKYTYNTPEEWKDDIVQEGFIGLAKAARDFRAELGFKFSSLAFKYIWQQMSTWVRRKNRNDRREVAFSRIGNETSKDSERAWIEKQSESGPVPPARDWWCYSCDADIDWSNNDQANTRNFCVKCEKRRSRSKKVHGGDGTCPFCKSAMRTKAQAAWSLGKAYGPQNPRAKQTAFGKQRIRTQVRWCLPFCPCPPAQLAYAECVAEDLALAPVSHRKRSTTTVPVGA